MGLNSEMKIYRHSENGVLTQNVNLDLEYGNPCGHLKFEEELKLNEQEEHYLTEIAGMLIYQNMMFGATGDKSTFYLVLEPIYIT